jgi:hypothetical protein
MYCQKRTYATSRVTNAYTCFSRQGILECEFEQYALSPEHSIVPPKRGKYWRFYIETFWLRHLINFNLPHTHTSQIPLRRVMGGHFLDYTNPATAHLCSLHCTPMDEPRVGTPLKGALTIDVTGYIRSSTHAQFEFHNIRFLDAAHCIP